MRKGHLLNDRYKINHKIGSGGMADVYLAKDTILERDVAIKALRSEYINDTEFTTRFDREAQAATSLSHPNIVNIFDVGEEEDILYMVMEYVDGLTLKEYIQQHGPIEVEEAVDIMKQIVSAIAHAHDNDIVHRDIKPQNILMNSFGQAKVTDFGIAIALSATSLTQTNSILGSVHYLSPEQARGGTATKKSDIYSIGIVFYELLTGRLPFSGQSPVSIALKHLQSETPSVRRHNQDIPQSVENVVLQATAKDPFHRYDSIYELEEVIENVFDPALLNVAPFQPPVEAGENTMAIPIIREDQYTGGENDQTIISKPNDTTKNYPDKNAAVSKKEAKKNEKQNKPKKGKRKKWLIILSIFFVLIVGSAAALFLIPGLMQPQDVELPDVIDWEASEARDELENLNLVVEEVIGFSDEIAEGNVMEMDPVAGRTVKEESTVTLTVSEGKERIIMEDYVGENFTEVSELLNEMGFDDIISIDVYSESPSGEILNQLQPSADAEVIPSETRVIFEVSIGPEPISLNNLTGMTESDARAYLDNNNLVMERHEEYSDNVEAGSVIRQSPESGTELVAGDTVDVYISAGREEIPPSSHTIHYTVPYTGEPVEEDPEEEENNNEPVEQVIKVYIGDINNNISDVYEELTITEDTPVSFTLVIAPDSDAEYLITRDDELVTSDIIPFEEGE